MFTWLMTKIFFKKLLKCKMHLLILTKIYFNLLTYFRSMESSKLNQSCSIQAFCPLLLKKLSLNMKLTNEKRFFEKNSI